MKPHWILILASSDFKSGRCVAGIDVKQIPALRDQFPDAPPERLWIRPVSSPEGGPLNVSDYKLEDGTEAEVWDIVEIDFLRDAPLPNQPENKLVNPNKPWKLIQKASPSEWWETLDDLSHEGPNIFGDNEKSIRMSSLKRRPANESLLLLRPWLPVVWKREWKGRKRPTTKAIFTHEEGKYELNVTDPVLKTKMLGWEVGIQYDTTSLAEYPHQNGEEVILVLSLGEPFKPPGQWEQCFKIVASVLLYPMEL